MAGDGGHSPHHVHKGQLVPVSGNLGYKTAEDVVITLPGDAFLPGNDVVGDTFRLLDQAEISFDLKEQVYGLVRGEGDRAVALATLASMDLPEGLFGALAEILTAFTEA